MMYDWGYHGYGFGFGFGLGAIGMLIVAALVVIPFWRICEKAGYSGFASLLVCIPLVNVIFLYWLAFSDWPSLRDGGLGPTSRQPAP